MKKAYVTLLLVASCMFAVTSLRMLNEQQNPKNNVEPLLVARVAQPTATSDNVSEIDSTLDSESSMPTSNFSEYYNENILLNKINAQRDARGLSPLILLDTLNVSADIKAYDMQIYEYFEHKDRHGKQGYDLIDEVGQACTGRGEVLFDNSVWEDSILSDAVRGWMNSSPHRALLMSDKYNSIGFGISERYVVGHLCRDISQPNVIQHL